MASWTEVPEMDQISLTSDALNTQRDIFAAARKLYQQAHQMRGQATEDTDTDSREFHLGNAESFERQAQRKLDILRRKGVLVEE